MIQARVAGILSLNSPSLGRQKRSEGTTLKWQAASAERIGGRNEQQDSVGFFLSRDGAASLLVVADGMGGHRGGSLASQTLLEIAERNWASCGGAPEDPKHFLEDLCQQAHSQINLRGREQDLEPHSTVVALIVRDAEAFWVHVGDSRLYHFRDQDLLGRTKDHSMVQVLVEAGEVTEEEMATHPDQNKLLRSIGGEDPPKTTHGNAALRPEDRFLLCSDGFWETITADEMAGALAERRLDESLAHLADLAAERGGVKGDNIAVTAVRPLEMGPTRRFRMPVAIGVVLVLVAGAILFVSSQVDWKTSVAPQTPVQEETGVNNGSEAVQVDERDGFEHEWAEDGDAPELVPEPQVPNALEEHDTLQAPDETMERVESKPGRE